MAQHFLHGIEAVDVATPSGPIRTVRTAIIGIVGSGTDLKEPGRRNVPILIRGAADAAATFGGSLGQYIEGILKRVSTLIVAVNVFDSESHFGPFGEGQEVTLVASSVAVADIPADADIEVRSQNLQSTYGIGDATAHLSWDGTTLTRNAVTGAPTATATLNFRYRVPDPSGAAVADVAGADGVARTGVYALLDAESVTGYRPGIIGAPDYSGRTTGAGTGLAAPVGAALQAVGDRLRAGFVVDTDAAASLADATAIRGLYSSRRGLVVSPWITRLIDGQVEREPASAQILAAIAASDTDPARGYWWSPTGVKLPDVVGTARPIDWGVSDPLSASNLLNEQHVMTVVRAEGVFRAWGDRSTSTEDKWKFWSIGRVADVIAESLVRSHLAFVSAPYTADYWQRVAVGVNAFLRSMRRRGALRFGRCVPSDRNTEATRADGQAFWRIEFQPPAPVERLTFELALTPDPDATEEVV